MKRAIVLSVLSVILLASKSEAQQFRFVTSLGVQQHWEIPYEVYHSIEHEYRGFDLVHARRVPFRRGYTFELIMRRGDVFVVVDIERNGRIVRQVIDYNYPLYDHHCSTFCGFHTTYYASQSFHHYHHGPRYRPVAIHYQNYSQPKHGHGHYKYDKGHGKNHHKSNKVDYGVSRRESVKYSSNEGRSRLNAWTTQRSTSDRGDEQPTYKSRSGRSSTD